MESKTKVSLSRADICRLVRPAFDGAEPARIRELVDGYFNTAYHVTLDDGRDTVLKVGPPADADVLTYERNILRAEVDAMKLVATDPAIPVPAVLYEDFSCAILPNEYYFMDFVEGVTWNKIDKSLLPEQNRGVEHQLGDITAHINAFEHSTFGLFAYGPAFDNWPDAFRWMCEALYADAERYDIELELSRQEFFDRLDAHRAIFAEVTKPQLVHWDLWAGNIFVAIEEDSACITGLIDFERSLWADPLMEAHLGRLQGIEGYMAGYGTNLLATQAQRLRRIFYNIYVHLIMIVEAGPRAYEDQRIVEWAQERLSEDMAMLRHGDVLE